MSSEIPISPAKQDGWIGLLAVCMPALLDAHLQPAASLPTVEPGFPSSWQRDKAELRTSEILQRQEEKATRSNYSSRSNSSSRRAAAGAAAGVVVMTGSIMGHRALGV